MTLWYTLLLIAIFVCIHVHTYWHSWLYVNEWSWVYLLELLICQGLFKGRHHSGSAFCLHAVIRIAQLVYNTICSLPLYISVSLESPGIFGASTGYYMYVHEQCRDTWMHKANGSYIVDCRWYCSCVTWVYSMWTVCIIMCICILVTGSGSVVKCME